MRRLMMKSRFLARLSVLGIIFFTVICLMTAPAVGKSIKPIIFTDNSWDSIQVHNRIAAFIVKHGMGYETDILAGETLPMLTGLMRGNVDVNMEAWIDNYGDTYEKGIESGAMIDLGSNFSDSWQGWYVPTYMIKGDPERNIEPMAPDLKSVEDLKKYWKLFQDPENPKKGRFYNSIPGWLVTKLNTQKLEAYGLAEYYTSFLPGSDAALAGSMVAAYEKGEPWFGYYWTPTWIIGKLDMTPIEEPPYDEKVWEETKACAFPPMRVQILVTKSLPERAPDVVEFLKKYDTTADICNQFLAYMQEHKASTEEAAVWFLKNYESLWTPWVTPEVAQKVKAALK